MARREFSVRSACGLTALALLFALPLELVAASKTGQIFKKPIRNPKFDPLAEQVDLFGAVEAGQVTVRLIPKNAMGGNVFIENKTDKALTVKIPDAVAAVSIHSQLPNAGLGNVGIGNPGGGNQGAGQQQLGGGIAPVGGNGPAAGNGPAFGNGQNGGPGFFSIPAESVVSLKFHSVCLEHGKPEPTSNSKYTLVPVSRVSRNPVLYQLLTLVGSGATESKPAQAAAWHLANQMSFQELAAKINTPLGSLTQTPDFSAEQIQSAEKLVAKAKQKAAEAELAASDNPSGPSIEKTKGRN